MGRCVRQTLRCRLQDKGGSLLLERVAALVKCPVWDGRPCLRSVMSPLQFGDDSRSVEDLRNTFAHTPLASY